MPDTATTTTTLERVTVLERLVHRAITDFRGDEHGILWDALVDARAALASAAAVVNAVTLDPGPRQPALVCVTCGEHLDPTDALDHRDYLFERAHHEQGYCKSGNEGTAGQ